MKSAGSSLIILSIRKISTGLLIRPVDKAPRKTPHISCSIDRFKIVKAQSVNRSGFEAVMNNLLPILQADVVMYQATRIMTVMKNLPMPVSIDPKPIPIV